MKKIITQLCVLLLLVGTLSAQKTINGSITDNSGESLIGANVLVKNSTVGTVTDFDGNFTLEVPSDANMLTVSYTGYTTQDVSIDGVSNIDIVMSVGEILDEVVVTALGISRNEKALGYAVQNVSSEQIAQSNAGNAIDALAGAAAGVQVTSSNGAAGASSRIVLRGQTSFNGNNQALMVVDGIRLNNEENSSERSLAGVANSNRAIDLNPDDIADITILKGASATALYGLEGARGVVLITTKRGANKPLKVELRTNYTTSQVSNITELQDTYAQGSNGVYQGPETGQSGSWGPNIADLRYNGDPDYKWDRRGALVAASDPSAGAGITPIDNVDDFFQTGNSLSSNIALSGGTKAADYRFSFGYSKDNGVTPNNEFTRYNLGINVGSTLFDDRLSVRFSGNYVNSGAYRIQQGSNISGVMLGLLRTPISFDNANGFANGSDESLAYQFADGSQRNYRGGGGYDNPFWVVNNTPFTDDVNRFFGSANLTYGFSDWFKVSTLLGLDTYSDNRVQRFEVGSRTNPGGQVIEDNYNYRHTDFYFSVLGNGNIAKDLTLSYNFGLNLYDEGTKNNYIQGDGLNFVGFPQIGNTSAQTTTIDNELLKTAGVYGTIDFGYKNFLYLTLTGRNDWSSTLINPAIDFNAGDISFFYPSVSMGFVFSEFMNSNVLSFGKVRASYAEVGGGAPSAYNTSTTWVFPIQNSGTIDDVNDGWTNGLGFPFAGTSGFTYSGVAGNPFLKPSRTKDREVGLDLRFFNGRISLDGSYYLRESVDQIIAINIPNTTGFQRAFVNSGELRTVGGEVILNVNPIRSTDVNWDLGFNWSKWRTTVESLPEGVQNQFLDGFTGSGIYNIAPLQDENGTIIEKYEYGQFLGGAFQRTNATDAAGNPTFDASGQYNPDGQLVINNDPTSSGYGYPLADPTNRVTGNPNPDWLLGITNSLRYKDLSLSFLFDIRSGGDIWNGTKGALTFFGKSQVTEQRGDVIVFDGILANSEGAQNNIAVPLNQAWFQGNGGGFGSVAEHFVEDASFARLRYATLSYNLGSLVRDAGFSNLSISFTGRNLLLITPYSGYDPELSLVGSSSNGQGLDYFQLPNTRSFSIGINADF